MNYEELAFANQQLAGMLKSGIPLEGSLKQLCATMRRGPLRSELEALEADLAKGTPLRDALNARKLPNFYVHMLRAGTQGNDLPGMLILLADYYSKAHLLWTRLKGLMVYPLIVLVAATVLSGLIASISGRMLVGANGIMAGELSWSHSMTARLQDVMNLGLWLPVFLLLAGTVTVVVVMAVPSYREFLRWQLPGFKDASLAQLASTASLLLRGGSTLSDTLTLTSQMERGAPVAKEMADWQTRARNGQGKINDIMAGAKVTPPLFVWLVASSGDDLVAGFDRAAEIYLARANNRIDMFLHAALPVSILMLGIMIVGQLWPVLRGLAVFMDMIGGGVS